MVSEKIEIQHFMRDITFKKSRIYHEGTTSPCNYDQGSPLVQATPSGNIVIGIMSKNNGCVSPYPPTIYTRLATYYSWIMQTAGQQPANL